MRRRNRVAPVSKKRKAKLNELRRDIDIDDHIINLDELEMRYHTSITNGLTTDQAIGQIRIYGTNTLHLQPSRTKCSIFMTHMFTGMAILIWIGAILSFVGHFLAAATSDKIEYDQLYLGIVLVTINLITGFYGYYQEAANYKMMDAFTKLVPKVAVVTRDGLPHIISAENLVPGDLVEIKRGDHVPADIRIIWANDFYVDNSSITGESAAQERNVECTNYNPLETENLAFFGTNAVEGVAKGIVIQTGDRTLMGHIAGLTAGLQPLDSPIKKELQRFMLIITIISLTVSTIVFVYAIVINEGFITAFLYFVGITVAQIPEGLTVTLTASLTLTAKRMAKKNCLVKTLHAVETLGQTSVICSDKTGTLTQNNMTVSHLFYDGAIVSAFSIIDSDNITGGSKPQSPHFEKLKRAGVLCSRAEFMETEPTPIHLRECTGDASEVAVLKFMATQVDVMAFRQDHAKIFEIPFNSTNKYQVSVHIQPNSDKLLLVMKGAYEMVINKCSTIMRIMQDITLTPEEKLALDKVNNQLGALGERVLAFADCVLPSKYHFKYNFSNDKDIPPNTLRLVGLISLIDPPKVGVFEAVLKCKSAGIKVIMVTGDHPITAMSVAKKVGIISPENETIYDIALRKDCQLDDIPTAELYGLKATVIKGGELASLDNYELDTVLTNFSEIVFSRTSPQQKLQIVESFQRCGYIVAVTGDGVNDSPALKKADTGIAMGIGGSDVSKDAADIILMDDNFATIVAGIQEGRLIYDNLKKSIAYIFTSNVPEVVPFLLMIVLGMPMTITIIAVLIIDVGTDLLPGISLAYEEAESDIMNRPPRDRKNENLVNRQLLYFVFLNIGVIQTLAGLSCYFYIMALYGFHPDRLIGINSDWHSDTDDIIDSLGGEWTKYKRDRLHRTASTAYFLAIVITQIADGIICKTRRLSIFQHGCGNIVMIYGIILEVCISAIVVYTPYLNRVLQFEAVPLYLLWPALPYALIIFAFDEGRKYFIRKFPTGFASRTMYF